jgi:hypothetical protein
MLMGSHFHHTRAGTKVNKVNPLLIDNLVDFGVTAEWGMGSGKVGKVRPH